MYRQPFRWHHDQETGGIWVRVCRDVDVVTRKGYRVTIGFEVDIALFRVGSGLYAVNNVCPHKHEAVLHTGHIDNDTITCPLHGWCFSILTGENIGGGKGLATYHVQLRGADVWVFLPETVELPPSYRT